MNLADPTRRPGSVIAHPCPNGRDDHQILEPDGDILSALGLPGGSRVHVDRSRTPRDGDLIWVELVRRGSTQRLLRRYSESGGVVTLAGLGAEPAIMRRAGELMVLGVVDLRPPTACRPAVTP